jgi:predicted HAD superfamily phosphohydrolase YqeG
MAERMYVPEPQVLIHRLSTLGGETNQLGAQARRTTGTEITPDMITYGLQRLVTPKLARAEMQLNSINNLPIREISNKYRALILGVEGTIMEYGAETIDKKIIEIIRAIRVKMPICAMTNNTKNASYIQAQLGTNIQVIRNVPLMPDPGAFRVAVSRLQNPPKGKPTVLNEECACLGSNPLTEGGCTREGIDFILVDPKTGNEGMEFRALRSAARYFTYL